MTIKDYILQELKAFDISEAQLLDMSFVGDYGLEDEYNQDTMKSVGVSIAGFIEKMVLAPKLSNVNEGGFSMSWDYGELSKYYLWLCRKWGIKPNDETLSIFNISRITDKSDCW